jgi:hypothetical protein
VAKDRFTFCFISDAAGIETRHLIGVDKITWECDYPHSDSTWPHAPEMAMKYLADVPDDEINKITHLNAMRHFKFDPFAVRSREQCTVGALRAEASDVDVSLMARTGKTRPKGTTAIDLKNFATKNSDDD